jgi:hypothetical protein
MCLADAMRATGITLMRAKNGVPHPARSDRKPVPMERIMCDFAELPTGI